MSSNENQALREQLAFAMRGDQAHIDFDSTIDGLTAELAGKKAAGLPHSAWQLLEHMRIAQHDILEFSRNPGHKSPKWPDEYWPETEAPPSEIAWEQSIVGFQAGEQAMEDLITNLQSDLFKPIEGGDGQTLLREALLVASHNSYHLGQLVFLKKALVNSK